MAGRCLCSLAYGQSSCPLISNLRRRCRRHQRTKLRRVLAILGAIEPDDRDLGPREVGLLVWKAARFRLGACALLDVGHERRLGRLVERAEPPATSPAELGTEQDAVLLRRVRVRRDRIRDDQFGDDLGGALAPDLLANGNYALDSRDSFDPHHTFAFGYFSPQIGQKAAENCSRADLSGYLFL